jgi:transcription elongation factor Elf1
MIVLPFTIHGQKRKNKDHISKTSPYRNNLTFFCPYCETNEEDVRGSLNVVLA